MGGVLWEASMEDKGASQCWEFFKNALLEAQNLFIPSKGKESRQRAEQETPLDLTVSFRVCSKPKEKCARHGKVDEHTLRTTRA